MFTRTLAPLVVFTLLAPASPSARPQDALGPTVHPALPSSPSELWLVPANHELTERSLVVYQPLTDAVAQIDAGDAARALTLLGRPSLSKTALADYASYYTALAQLRLSRVEDARAGFEAIRTRRPA